MLLFKHLLSRTSNLRLLVQCLIRLRLIFLFSLSLSIYFFLRFLLLVFNNPTSVFFLQPHVLISLFMIFHEDHHHVFRQILKIYGTAWSLLIGAVLSALRHSSRSIAYGADRTITPTSLKLTIARSSLVCLILSGRQNS